MTYRLRHGGEDLGSATLEELRQRLADGRLTGAEQVQAEDSPDWQPLASLMAPAEPPPLPPLVDSPRLPPLAVPPPLAPPPPRSRSRRPWVLAAVGLGLLVSGYLLYLERPQAPAVLPAAVELPRGVEVASRPVKAGSSPTQRDVTQRERRFKLRQWLEGYQRRSVRLPSADGANEKFIRVFIDRAEDGPEADDPLQLDADALRIGQDLAEKDPLILTMAAQCTTNWYRRVELFERALALYPASRHRAYPLLYAQVLRMAQSKDDYDKLGPLNGEAIKAFERCLVDGSFQPGDQQEIAGILIDGWGSTFFANNQNDICDLVARAGPDYHWLALVLTGQSLSNAAWEARGTGYSNTVTDSGWAAFHRDLEDAKLSLTEAWKLHPDYPLAAVVGESVALGSGAEEARMWFDRAVAAQVDQPMAWSAMRWALRPRWFGSTAAELALGQTALNTGRFDTDVPRKLIDCVSDLEEETEHAAGRHLYGRSDVWPGLQRMYEGYVASPDQAKRRKGWRASFAIVAYFAGHNDVAAQQLEQIGWELPPASLTSWGTDLSVMPLEVAARTSPVAKEIAAAEKARAAGNRADALRRFTALAAGKAVDARTQEFIHFRIAHLRQEQQVEDGRWMSLIPASDRDHDWVFQLGEAHRTPSGDLEVEYGPKGFILYPKIQVGADFEVRGSFEVVRSSNTNFQAGIVIGLPDFERDLNGDNWWGFRLKRHDEEGDVACFGEGWTLRETKQRVALNDKVNTFDLVVAEDRFTIVVNGQRVITNAEVPSGLNIPENTYFVGLGAYSDSADTVVRYHNVEVRKLALTEDALTAAGGQANESEIDPESDDPETAKPREAVKPRHPDLPAAGQIAADTIDLNQAVDRVKEIVNRPAPSVVPKEGMHISWWNGGWFHPGADVPDYAAVDVSKTRENPYQRYEYVASDAHPDMAFLGRDLEFNSKTKFYYTDRTLPKRKLTRAEMAEINRLYRIIGQCQADLARLQAK